MTPRDYNLWTGFIVAPSLDASGAGCARYLAHVRDIICSGNEEYANYLLDWMACTVPAPGDRIGVAVALRGAMGAGKGTFAAPLQRIFGKRHSLHLDKLELLTGRFTGHLASKVFVFADETIWGGNKQHLGAIKRLIAEPSIVIERKGSDAYEERNCIHLVSATNEDWHVPAGADERRWFVLNVDARVKQNIAYFGETHREMAESGGDNALLAFLLARGFDRTALRTAPRTEALATQQTLSLSAEMSWLYEALYAGNFRYRTGACRTGIAYEPVGDDWPDVVPLSALHDHYRAWCEMQRVQHVPRAEELAEVLKRVGATQSGRRQGRRVWKLLSVAESRARYDAVMGTTRNWDSEENEAA